MREVWNRSAELMQILKMIAPGTELREGLDNVLKAKTGGLIVIGDSESVLKLVDGGFKIDQDYTPARLYELAKMDGAIVLSKDAKKILYANTQLTPDATIYTAQTGTRHRTSERMAKQTNELVVCISQRRNVISLFKGNISYLIKDTSQVLARANQALQTFEKYKSTCDDVLSTLNEFEFEDIVTLENVIKALQRAELAMRVAAEVEGYIIELGDEGRLIELQLKELSENIEKDEKLILKDYSKDGLNIEELYLKLTEFSRDEVLDARAIAKLMGYESDTPLEDIEVSSRGYRLLNKIPKMPTTIIENMVAAFGNFKDIIRASIEELDDVEGIGEIRAKNIKQGLRRMQEQFLYDSKFYR
ncbi:MAG: DNA integrity scanning diadenylate cyclase DisA [Clostridia bacterium]|nr:DNA integrity scanning diadenylate cyclase DisA [Clostridia bacterium]